MLKIIMKKVDARYIPFYHPPICKDFNIINFSLSIASFYFNGYILRNTASIKNASEVITTFSQGLIDAAEYDEIDQIYDYIRGVGSLPRNLNLNLSCETNDDDATKIPKSSHGIEKMVESENKQLTRKIQNKLGVASLRSSVKYGGVFHNIKENSQLIRYCNVEKPTPPSISTIPSKLKTSLHKPTLMIGKTNISNGQKIFSSQHCSQIHQSPFFDIR